MFFLFNVKFWYESLIFMDSLFFLCVCGGWGWGVGDVVFLVL